MNIALIHDGLFAKGGAERVFLNFCEAYPDADIYTSVYLPEKTFPDFKKYKIRTSSLSRFIHNEGMFKWLFFPFVIYFMSRLNLENYDLVLVSTTHCAKYPKMSDKALKVFYCYTPFRLAWCPDSYELGKSNKIVGLIKGLIVNYLRKIDYKHAQKADIYIAMTKETCERIKNSYDFKKEIPIIEPSINVERFKISSIEKDYYLLVSRFEPYKKVDLAIKVFNKLNRKLVIVGNGTQKEYLKRLAGPSIEFKEGISDEELINLYSNCKGFIFPQYEDYGLTPIEANASGRPAICFRAGGALDTMIDIEADPEYGTALFFNEQTVESLSEAIIRFETLKFEPNQLRDNAMRFDRNNFIRRIKLIISNRYRDLHLKKC